ncbi:MAG: hypothetical protein ACT4O1_06155 [Gemmatimonadota bacterium]
MRVVVSASDFDIAGGGERLFDNVADLHDLVLVDTVAAPNVVHLKFARK